MMFLPYIGKPVFDFEILENAYISILVEKPPVKLVFLEIHFPFKAAKKECWST